MFSRLKTSPTVWRFNLPRWGGTTILPLPGALSPVLSAAYRMKDSNPRVVPCKDTALPLS